MNFDYVRGQPPTCFHPQYYSSSPELQWTSLSCCLPDFSPCNTTRHPKLILPTHKSLIGLQARSLHSVFHSFTLHQQEPSGDDGSAIFTLSWLRVKMATLTLRREEGRWNPWEVITTSWACWSPHPQIKSHRRCTLAWQSKAPEKSVRPQRPFIISQRKPASHRETSLCVSKDRARERKNNE